MKKIEYCLICLSMFLCLSCLNAQTQEWLWATGVDGTCTGQGQAIAVDNQGNSYVTGFFENTATFGTTSLTCSGYRDIFVAKIDSFGNWLWAKQAGSPINDAVWGDEFGYDIAVDSAGNVYIIGAFWGTASFGSLSLTSSGDSDIFVAKLDHNGNWIWAQHAGGLGRDNGYGIALDNSNNVYLTGGFSEVANFGNNSLISSGDIDIFAAKMDNGGNWIWAKKAGGVGFDKGYSITATDNNDIYLTGIFCQSASFGNTTFTGCGAQVAFVCKLDYSGNWQWATHPEGAFYFMGFDITHDNTGDVYVSGNFFSAVSFGSTTLSADLTFENAFIAKLNSAGSWLWAKQVGSGLINCMGVAVDSDANVYLTGRFYTSVYFGSIYLSGFNAEVIYAAKLDSSGSWLWAKQAGGLRDDYAFGIASDDADHVYLTGRYWGNVSIGATIILDGQHTNIYVAKIGTEIGHLSGIVYSGSELPLAGVTVYVGSIRTTTNTNGEYTLSLPEGIYTVNFKTEDNIIQTLDNVSITVDQTTHQDFWIVVSNQDEQIIHPNNFIITYPNPARNNATFKYALTKDSEIELCIYNNKGQLVKTLNHGKAKAGEYSTKWNCLDNNGNKVSSGIYLYKLQSGSKSFIQKLVLIKQ